MRIFALAVGLMLGAMPVSAYTLRYSKQTMDVPKFVREVEAATGLRLAAPCATMVGGRLAPVQPAECFVNGYLTHGSGQLVIVVYDRAGKRDPRITPVKVTAAIRLAITNAVKAHQAAP